MITSSAQGDSTLPSWTHSSWLLLNPVGIKLEEAEEKKKQTNGARSHTSLVGVQK